MQGRESLRTPPSRLVELISLQLLQAQDGGQTSESVEDILDEADDGADVNSAGESGDGVQQAGDGVDERAEVDVDVDGGVDLTLRQASQAAEVETAKLGDDVVQCRGDLCDGGLDVRDSAVDECADERFNVADLAGQGREQTCHGRQEAADQVRHWCQVESELALAKVQVSDEAGDVVETQIKTLDGDSRGQVDVVDGGVEAEVALGGFSFETQYVSLLRPQRGDVGAWNVPARGAASDEAAKMVEMMIEARILMDWFGFGWI
jgi:hypothetical protein